MGYNISRHSVMRQLPQLQALLHAEESLRFPTANPRRLAFKLREALKAAEAFPEFAEFAPLVTRFRFREETGAVLAEYLGVIDPEAVEESDIPMFRNEVRPQKKTLPGAVFLMDILALVIKFTHEEELYFPDARLPEEDKARLDDWLNEQSEAWNFIDHSYGGGQGLTLTKKEVPEEIIWRP